MKKTQCNGSIPTKCNTKCSKSAKKAPKGRILLGGGGGGYGPLASACVTLSLGTTLPCSRVASFLLHFTVRACSSFLLPCACPAALRVVTWLVVEVRTRVVPPLCDERSRPEEPGRGTVFSINYFFTKKVLFSCLEAVREATFSTVFLN